MTPREVIARAIREGYEARHLKTDVWLEMADAVIDALEKMEVTEVMAVVYWCGQNWQAQPTDIWRAMVGAMRNE